MTPACRSPAILREKFDATLIEIVACDPQPAHYAGGSFAKVSSRMSAQKSRSEWRKPKSAFDQRSATRKAMSSGDLPWRDRWTM